MSRSPLPPAICLLAALAGCEAEEEGIRVYTVENVSGDALAAAPPAAAAPPVARGMTGVQAVDEPQRLLGAIVERDERLWFFKLIGPVAAVSDAELAFGQWMRSVRFDGGEPAWDVPAGWDERPGSGMRFATLAAPGGLEATVISLPVRGEVDEQIAANFTRWRGQVGATGGGEVDEVTLADGSAATLLSVSSPDDAATVTSAEPAAVPFEFELPDGWEPAAPSPMTRLAFRTGPGENAAGVTVSRFPAGSMPVATIAGIWREQAGAADGTTDGDPLTVAGDPAPRIDLPPKNRGGAAVFGTAAERGGALWLFKLAGSQEAVDAARPAFERFLAALRFPDTDPPAGAPE